MSYGNVIGQIMPLKDSHLHEVVLWFGELACLIAALQRICPFILQRSEYYLIFFSTSILRASPHMTSENFTTLPSPFLKFVVHPFIVFPISITICNF